MVGSRCAGGARASEGRQRRPHRWPLLCLRLQRGSGVRRWGLEGRGRGYTRWGSAGEDVHVASPRNRLVEPAGARPHRLRHLHRVHGPPDDEVRSGPARRHEGVHPDRAGPAGGRHAHLDVRGQVPGDPVPQAGDRRGQRCVAPGQRPGRYAPATSPTPVFASATGPCFNAWSSARIASLRWPGERCWCRMVILGSRCPRDGTAEDGSSAAR
jgi:hypothetical protein